MPEQNRIWRPILTVQVIHNHATTKRFEAIVDTGSDYCLFDATIGASIGMKIVEGREGPLSGIIPGTSGKVYYHDIKLVVSTEIVEIKAGFSWDLTSNVLGFYGFFTNFMVTLNTVDQPPYFDVERVYVH